MTNRTKWNKNWVATRKSQGGCIRCALPAMPGRTLCEEHAAYSAAVSAKLFAKRISDGRCFYCPEKVVDGRRRCQKCREKHNAKQRAKKQRQTGGSR